MLETIIHKIEITTTILIEEGKKVVLAGYFSMPLVKDDRIHNLKSLKTLANNYLRFYKNLKNEKTKSWIHSKVENSIQELKKIINQINKDLHPKKVEVYCKPLPSFENITFEHDREDCDEKRIFSAHFSELLEQTDTNSFLFDIVRLSPEQNIIHDISWLTDGVRKDYIDVASGNKRIDFFANFLPEKIESVQQQLIPFLEGLIDFSEKIKIIKEAIEHTKKNNFLVSNILLITVTESIVREVCKFVYQKQNPSYSKEKVNHFIYNKFNSLDTLLTKGIWKNDYPIKLIEAILIYKDVDEVNINEWKKKFDAHKKANRDLKEIVNKYAEIFETLDTNKDEITQKIIQRYLHKIETVSSNLLPEKDFNISINILIMFHFLIRKYKDDRNLIIHGNFEAFNHKWKNYINYSALLKVYEVFKNYTNLYFKKKAHT